MYKAIRREFRRIRRKLAQYILGFETCPKDYMKNRKQATISFVCNLGLVFAAIGFFALLSVYFS